VKAKAKDRSKSLEFWYRRKFNLAPTDTRFLDTTVEEMLVEHWAWHYLDHPNEIEDTDDEFDIEAVKAEMEANPEDWETV